MSQRQREQRNLKIVTRMLEQFVEGKYEYFLSLLDSEFSWNSDLFVPPPGELRDSQDIHVALEKISVMFPDAQVEITSLTGAGDTVTVVARLTGNKLIGFMGMPELLGEFSIDNCELYQFSRAGKILRKMQFMDRGSLLSQLGLLPPIGLFGPSDHSTRVLLDSADITQHREATAQSGIDTIEQAVGITDPTSGITDPTSMSLGEMLMSSAQVPLRAGLMGLRAMHDSLRHLIRSTDGNRFGT